MRFRHPYQGPAREETQIQGFQLGTVEGRERPQPHTTVVLTPCPGAWGEPG